MQCATRSTRRVRIFCTGLLSGFLLLAGCDLLDPDTDIARAFRQAYVPGLIEGLSTAVTTPDNAEAGLRRTVTAFLEGLGAVLTPGDSQDSDR